MTVNKKLLIKFKVFNQMSWYWCYYNEEKMLYPARWKKIAVDQSKVLKMDCSVIFGPPGIRYLIPLSHLPAIGRRPPCALGLRPFSPKRSENAEKCSPHLPLTRSHCNHLRSRCDSSTLSMQVCYVLYARTAPKSPSLHFRYVYMGYSATSSVSFKLSAAVCAP